MSTSKIGGNLLGGFTMGIGGGGWLTKGIHKVVCFRHPGGINDKFKSKDSVCFIYRLNFCL